MAESDFSGNKILNKLMMYERRIENSMYKSIKQLKKLKNEPISSTTERKEQRYELPEASEVDYEKLPITLPPEVEKIISRIRKNLKLDEIKDSNIENKESNIENPVSSIENPVSSIEKMKNEPNSNPPCHCEEQSDAAISTTPLHLASPMSSQESQNMQNEPNLQEQSNLTPAITKDYEHALLHGYPPDKPYPPQKPINNPKPKTDSTNHQLKSSIKRNNDLISRRNQGRSEAYSHPRRPIRARFNKK